MRVRHDDAQPIRRGHAGRENDAVPRAPRVFRSHPTRRDQRSAADFFFVPLEISAVTSSTACVLRDASLQPRDARRSVVQRRKIFLARLEQMHRTIQSAIDGKIAAQRRDVRQPRCLTRTASRFVPLADKLVGDFKTKRAKSAAMFAEKFCRSNKHPPPGWPPRTAENIFCRLPALMSSSRRYQPGPR